jgi:hypothetical protein
VHEDGVAASTSRLGSSHGAEVAAGKTLHYVWMDFSRGREGLKWLETHKPNEPKSP